MGVLFAIACADSVVFARADAVLPCSPPTMGGSSSNSADGDSHSHSHNDHSHSHGHNDSSHSRSNSDPTNNSRNINTKSNGDRVFIERWIGSSLFRGHTVPVPGRVPRQMEQTRMSVVMGRSAAWSFLCSPAGSCCCARRSWMHPSPSIKL